MRILVCGGRAYNNKAILNTVLAAAEPTLIITGMASGADSLAWAWAKENHIPTKEYPAKWELFGKSAGFKRNQQMLDEGKPDLVIAFPGGNGTAHMIRIAKATNIPVTIIG